MISHASGDRSNRHGQSTDNMSTVEGMIYRASRNMISCHGYPMYNARVNSSSHHDDPVDSAITAGAGRPRKVYTAKNQ